MDEPIVTGRVRCRLCVHSDEFRPPRIDRSPMSTRSVKSILWPAVIVLPAPRRKRGSRKVTDCGLGIELISLHLLMSL